MDKPKRKKQLKEIMIDFTEKDGEKEEMSDLDKMMQKSEEDKKKKKKRFEKLLKKEGEE